jgi:hypothetical protein
MLHYYLSHGQRFSSSLSTDISLVASHRKRHKLRSARRAPRVRKCARTTPCNFRFAHSEKNLIDETLCKCNGRAFAPNCAHTETRLQTCDFLQKGRRGLFFCFKKVIICLEYYNLLVDCKFSGKYIDYFIYYFNIL